MDLIVDIFISIGAEYVSILLVIPCIKGIMLKLEAIRKTLSCPAALSFHKKILQFIEEKLMHYKQRTISKVATLIQDLKKQDFIRKQIMKKQLI